MAEVAAHLTDHVLPDEAPIRQWVLSLPHRVRYLLAREPDLCREVRGIFVRAVQSFYVRRARDAGLAGGRCGAVVCTQRSDTALRLDVHFHALVIDGVYTGFGLGERVAFHPATFIRDAEIQSLAQHVRALTCGHLRRRGYLADDADVLIDDAEPSEEQLHHAAATAGAIPLGPRAGQRATLFGDPPDTPPSTRPKKKLCADVAGYSLHAAIRCGAGQTSRLERLCRYIARPPFASERLSIASDGSIVYRFRKPWRNGKLAVVMDPMTFLSRLAAQIPPPRRHVLSYYGVLAPAAAKREQIVPGHPEPEACHDPTTTTGPGGASSHPTHRRATAPAKMLWAELVRRVFLDDVLACPCGGRRRVLAMVFDPDAIEQVLRHLGLPTTRPARAPPRPVQQALALGS
jgi:hypothetical protein